MNNPETLGTLSTQDTGQINVRDNQRQSRMDNPEIQAQFGTRKRMKTNRKTQHRKTQKTKKMSNTDQHTGGLNPCVREA